MEIFSVWLIIVALLNACFAIPLSMFYPYGNPSHDILLPQNDDDSSSEIHISSSFPFFNSSHRSLFVNTNGDLTFLSSLSSFTPTPFPYLQNSQIIAIYWGDIDTRKGGDIWYRETTDSALLQKASTEIHSVFPQQSGFNASWIFVTTWSNVAFYGASSIGQRKRNTFQCVLVTDGTHSFVIYNYYKIQWTTGTSNNGSDSTGLGGIPAQVGFDAGDGVNYYVVNGSRTPGIINIPQMSNVGIPGKYIFRVDLASIEQATLVNECDEQVCLHNGTCQDLDGLSTWLCNCVSGFTGIHCETDINECHSSPCQHDGNCLNLLDDYRCHCQAGYSGNDCQIDIDECQSNPCMNGATCRDRNNSYTCDCQQGYVGNNCQIDVDECQSNPCYNNATCIDKTPGWNCACIPGYTGNQCQIATNECNSNPCRNNGTCVDLINGYKCYCSNESIGQHCEHWMDHCSSYPCLHEGTCINKYDGFKCECIDSWFGDICEYRQTNESESCSVLEYSECSCFTQQLKQNKTSNKMLIGSVGYVIGFLFTILSYCAWIMLNKSQRDHKIYPHEATILQREVFKENKNAKKSAQSSQRINKLHESRLRKQKQQKEHHNCFLDHSGFDFSKLYVNEDGSRKILKCRHQRVQNDI